MRAVRLVAAGTPLVASDIAEPTPVAGEALVDVAAAGICRSDAHYRSGRPKAPPVPRTLGHEIAGTIRTVTGSSATPLRPGDRVVVHYQVSCGACEPCRRGVEQFCPDGAMIGNQLDGGFAEAVAVPVRNLVPVPDELDLTHAAVLACSAATVMHALRRTRMRRGDRVAVFGLGGLGMSAVQIARALGADRVFGVDVNPAKLELAASLGAIPVDPDDPVGTIRAAGGVDVSLELVGLPETTVQAIEALRWRGRAGLVGLSEQPATIHPYFDLIGAEAEVLGVMDHHESDLRDVIDLAAAGALDLEAIVSRTVPLDAAAINATLDGLERNGDTVRTVVVPGAAPLGST